MLRLRAAYLRRRLEDFPLLRFALPFALSLPPDFALEVFFPPDFRALDFEPRADLPLLFERALVLDFPPAERALFAPPDFFDELAVLDLLDDFLPLEDFFPPDFLAPPERLTPDFAALDLPPLEPPNFLALELCDPPLLDLPPEDLLPVEEPLRPAARPANAPITPPITAPTGPATLPMTAPAAVPAACFETGGMEMLSEPVLPDDSVFSSAAII